MSQEQAPSQAVFEGLEAIPGVRYETGARLAPYTTLQIGGPAAALVTVGTEDALVGVVRLARSLEVPLHLLGLGSNVLIPDDGLQGIVLRLDGDFKRIRVHGDRVRAGAAVPLGQLARKMSARGLCGLEALSGFPSTVGGAVFMNAGCYGTEISDLLETVGTVTSQGGCRRRLRRADLGAGYRSTRLQQSGDFVIDAVLRLRPGDSDSALLRIAELNRRRRSSMPTLPNAGSIFRNPDGGYAGRLIDATGLKGTRMGQAQISDRHANVVVNLGGATAVEVMDLLVLMRRRVLETSGVELEPEIVLSGSLRCAWRASSGNAE